MIHFKLYLAALIFIVFGSSAAYLRTYLDGRIRLGGMRIEMQSSSAYKYESKIRSLIDSRNQNSADHVEEVFSLMLKNGYRPMLNTSIEVLSILGLTSPSRASAVFDRMQVYEATTLQHVEIYNVLLESWMQSGTEDCMNQVSELLKRMKFNVIAPNKATYQILLNINSSMDMTSARPLSLVYFEEMEEAGYVPSLEDYRSVLKSLNSYHGIARKLDSFLRRMIELTANDLSVDDFEKAISAWERQGTIDAAERINSLFHEMDVRSIPVPGSLRLQFIKACCKSLQANPISISSASSAGLSNILNYFHILLDSRNVNDIQAAADMILEVGSNSNAVTFKQMIEILKDMLSHDIIPSTKSFTWACKKLEFADNSHVAFANLTSLLKFLDQKELYSLVIKDLSFVRSVIAIMISSEAINSARSFMNDVLSSQAPMIANNFIFSVYTTFIEILLQKHISNGDYADEVSSLHQLMCYSAETSDEVSQCIHFLAEALRAKSILISDTHYRVLSDILSKHKEIKDLTDLVYITDIFLESYTSRNSTSTIPRFLRIVIEMCSLDGSRKMHLKARDLYNTLKRQAVSGNFVITAEIIDIIVETCRTASKVEAKNISELLLADMIRYKISPSVKFYNFQLSLLLDDNSNGTNSHKVEELFYVANQVDGFPNEDTVLILSGALNLGTLPATISVDSIFALTLSLAVKHSKPIDYRVSSALISFWVTDKELLKPSTTKKVYALLKYMCLSTSCIQDVPTYKSLSVLLREHPDKKPSTLEVMGKNNLSGQQLLIPFNILLVVSSFEAVDHYFKHGFGAIVPDTLSLNIVLDRIFNERPQGSFERYLEFETLISTKILPNDETYALLGSVFLKKRYWQGARKLVRSFDIYRNSNTVSKKSFINVIKFLCRVSSLEYSKIAARYLKILLAEYGGSDYDNIVNIVLKSLISNGAPLEANSILQNELHEHGLYPHPDVVWDLVNAISHSENRHAFDELDLLTKSLFRYNMSVDERIVQGLLMCISRSNSGNAIARAERVFKEYVLSGNISISIKLLNCLLDVYAKCNQPNAADLSESFLLNRFDSNNIQPDIVSYNTAISAWSRSKKINAFQRALSIFQSAKARGVTVNVISYTALLTALSRSKKSDAPELALELFSSMKECRVEPDLQTWTILLGIWSKRSCKKAQEIFDAMVDAGIQPNNVTYTILLSMWGQSSERHASNKIRDIFKQLKQSGKKLDGVGYSSLLSAMSSNAVNDSSTPIRALEVFDTMKLNGFKPDLQAYTIIIGCLAKFPVDYSETCFSLYAELIRDGLAPSAVTFSTMLNLLRYSRHANTQYWIDVVSSHMMSSDQFFDGQTVKCFIGALGSVYSKLEIAIKVDKLLSKFIKRAIPVDQSACNAVFRAWENVRSEKVVDKARSFSKLMISYGLKPSSIAYSSLISMLSRELKSNDESIRSLLETYRMNRDGSSDPTVYNSVIAHFVDQAIKNPMQSDKISSCVYDIAKVAINDSIILDNSTLKSILQIYDIACSYNRELVPEAYQLAQDIIRIGNFKHSVLSQNALLSILSRGGRDDMILLSEQLLSETDLANGATYFYLFKCYASTSMDQADPKKLHSLCLHFQKCISFNFLNSKLFTVFLTALLKWLPTVDTKFRRKIVSQIVQSAKSAGVDIDEKYHFPILSKLLYYENYTI